MAHDDTDVQLTDLESSPSKSDRMSLQNSKEISLSTNLNLVLPTSHPDSGVPYRLYKRRFSGMLGFVVLSAVSAMGWPWFGPISNDMATDFNLSLDQVNWLGNLVSCVYLPTAILVPICCSKWGIRRCCDIGVVALLIAAWVRYAGTVHSLSREGAYALLIVGQLFIAIAQPIFQVLGPMYSETWFDLKGRTTATMIISVSNPVGGALGQLISPIPGNTRHSILILGIISTAAIPFVFLIGEAPPIPPTYAGSRKPPSLLPLLRAMLGMHNSHSDLYGYMTIRERIDFTIVIIVFGVLVGAANSFALLTAEIFEPAGYSDTTSGLMGATLLLSGLVAAIITSPLFDRVFTHHLAVTSKVLVPMITGAWLSLIWAVKPGNSGGLFAVMAIVGAGSITMLPVGLELGCELTRNSSASSALLWFSGNLFAIMMVLVGGALRAPPTASPPLNMHKALIFNGVFIMVACASIFFIRGTQVRRENDVRMGKERQERGG